MNETLIIINDILDILKKCPIHKSKDHNDEIMYCDLDYKMICYSIENMRLFEIKTMHFPAINHNGNTRESFHKTLAKMRLKYPEKEYKNILDAEFEIVYSKSDIELAELLQELKENHAIIHVL